MKVVLDGNSIEIYIGRFRLELWFQVMLMPDFFKVYVIPSLSFSGAKSIRGLITTIDWLTFNMGMSLRWMTDEDMDEFLNED